MNILCIGDSLTEGDYGSEPEGTANVHEENYPYFLSKLTSAHVVNAGKCGYTATAYAKHQLKKLDFSIYYDYVIIMLGTNYAGDRDYENYCRIIDFVQDKNRNEEQHSGTIILCTCPYADPIRRSRYASNVEKANQTVRSIADKYHLPVFDVNRESGINADTSSFYQPIDGLHFGREGYLKLAEYLAKQLNVIK